MNLYVDQAVLMLEQLAAEPLCGGEGKEMVEDLIKLLDEVRNMEDMVDQNQVPRVHVRLDRKKLVSRVHVEGVKAWACFGGAVVPPPD